MRIDLNETVQLGDIRVTVSEMSSLYYGEADGYEETAFGYLQIKYKAESTGSREFICFGDISINGKWVEYYGLTDFDGEYVTMVLPLSVPYSDIRSIEFESADLMLKGEVRFEFSLKFD